MKWSDTTQIKKNVLKYRGNATSAKRNTNCLLFGNLKKSLEIKTQEIEGCEKTKVLAVWSNKKNEFDEQKVKEKN